MNLNVVRMANLFALPGMFRHLNAIGWTIDEYGFCQISCNVLDFTRWAYTHYDAVRELALQGRVVVTGSELVGLFHWKPY